MSKRSNTDEDKNRPGESLGQIIRRLTGKLELPVEEEQIESSQEPWRIILQQLGTSSEAIGMDFVGSAVVGRADAGKGVNPDVDLGPYGGKSAGISRQHAVLMPTDEGLSLIDLDSTNGTVLNGERLKPGHRYRIRSGDRVEFGTLRFVVRMIGNVQVGRTDDSTFVIPRKTDEDD